MRTGLRMAGGEKSLNTSVSQIVAMPSPSIRWSSFLIRNPRKPHCD
jgi:hypothetical protein